MTKRFTKEEAHARKLLSMKRWRDTHAAHLRTYSEERAAGVPPRPRGRPLTRDGDRDEYLQQWRLDNRARTRELARRPEVLQKRRDRYRALREENAWEAAALPDDPTLSGL